MPARAHTPTYHFSRARRLPNSSDYQAVFAAPDRRISHRYYLLLARLNDGPEARLGLVVARKNIRMASARNRVKRVVRETFRHRAGSLPRMDVLFLPRRGMDGLAPARQTRLLREAWAELDRAFQGEC